LGEFGLIEHLTRNIEIQNASTIVGVGDDAAVIDHFGKQTVVTTDLLIEGVHFDLMYTPLRHLGYKSVVVNLSDVYAMNAIPTQITLSIGISNRVSLEALDEFYDESIVSCENEGNPTIGLENYRLAAKKYLDNISDNDIVNLNIPTGVPLVYKLNDDLKPLNSMYLGDAEAIRRKAEAVANQGRAR